MKQAFRQDITWNSDSNRGPANACVGIELDTNSVQFLRDMGSLHQRTPWVGGCVEVVKNRHRVDTEVLTAEKKVPHAALRYDTEV